MGPPAQKKRPPDIVSGASVLLVSAGASGRGGHASSAVGEVGPRRLEHDADDNDLTHEHLDHVNLLAGGGDIAARYAHHPKNHSDGDEADLLQPRPGVEPGALLKALIPPLPS